MENSSNGDSYSESVKNEEAGDLEENVYNEKDNGIESSTFDFTENSWRADFVLIVEGTKLYVARNILSLVSPVFDRMFQSDFKEKQNGELELPGKKKEQFVEFLRFIYPNAPARIAFDTARNILPLADEYQVMNIKSRCEDVLIESISTDTTALEIFHILREACMYDLRKLREKCVSIVTERDQTDLEEANQECLIPKEAWAEILEKINQNQRERLLEMENTVKDLLEQIEILKEDVVTRKQLEDLETNNKLLNEKLEIIWQYLNTESKVSGDLGLDGAYNWKSEQFIFTFDIESKGVVVVENITIWDMPLKISVSISDSLTIRIENKGKKIQCTVVIKSMLVCRQPSGKNEKFMLKGKWNGWWLQSTNHDLKKVNEINGACYGFKKNGKIGMIVQVWLSEPNGE